MINGPEWINFVSVALTVIHLLLTRATLSALPQVNEGQDITYRNITISAVSTSKNAAKNTDGWDIFRSDNVVIEDSTVNNGDDCVSFKPST